MTPISGIITGGLGLPACQGMITNTFHLFCGLEVTVPVIDLNRQGGGSHPMAPGEIQKFWKPVDKQPEFYTPQNSVNIIPKNLVVVKMTFGEKTVEKEFLVGPKRLDVIVKVLRLMISGREKMSVVVSGVKRVLHKAAVKIFNLRKRP